MNSAGFQLNSVNYDIARCVYYIFDITKNKTLKKLILKFDQRINLPVTRVAAFETDKGIGNRCGDTRERESATVC